MLRVFEGAFVAKTPPRSGKQWTGSEETKLDEYRSQNMPTRVIAWKLGRSVDSIYSKASDDRKTLKPTNQSPYNRRKR